jgi:hypothetical protein
MPVSHAIRRLLQIRELQEEQSRLALETVLGELRQLESALRSTMERDRLGRILVVASVEADSLPDRVAGLVESSSASQHAGMLLARVEAAEREAAALQQDFLFKRVERRQAETLIEEIHVQDETRATRRGQQTLDDWHSARILRRESGLMQHRRIEEMAEAEEASFNRDDDGSTCT